jgi:hypothetical protein
MIATFMGTSSAFESRIILNLKHLGGKLPQPLPTNISKIEARDRALFVMAGLVPAIHVFVSQKRKTWMPGSADKCT